MAELATAGSMMRFRGLLSDPSNKVEVMGKDICVTGIRYANEVGVLSCNLSNFMTAPLSCGVVFAFYD